MSNIIKFSANRVWRTYMGGKMLDTIEDKANPEDTHFPEDWIGSTVEARNVGREHISEGLAHIANITGAAVTFKEIVEQNRLTMLGQSSEGQFGLEDIPLVKYLDSATRLHFQAHPTREFAQQRLGMPRGKTEAYVILATRDDIAEPYIYAGFQRPPSREQLKVWIETQDIGAIEKCFDKIPVKPGDVFLIPGGRPHALGEGILMLEIMEPSDLAVRFEFERCGYVIPEAARFMNRDIETALDVFNFDPVPTEQVDNEFRCQPSDLINEGGGNRLEKLIDAEQTPCFSIRRAEVQGDFARTNDAFFIGVVVQGSGTLRVGDEAINLTQWERFFCPAKVKDFAYHSSEGMTIIECYPGGL
ncbi:class I mannose-6-phosphate isomerase [Gilvimarinus sp. 1_MG-2023]|uniref:class I mannose-6-phosphate isomerase n=1 Tax=Gilvimarinus sp. 1_MG-2023 TaxID=3062638 RepID=UPI0026E11540|nr:class I mannose-6-phosphate isomerase [Gilvimarinus sp. 1_MG-2023]MDO6746539.1 class I mannose-6-phosphate isomerase [Gilvimarinus sp. 1_MG-2023]